MMYDVTRNDGLVAVSRLSVWSYVLAPRRSKGATRWWFTCTCNPNFVSSIWRHMKAAYGWGPAMYKALKIDCSTAGSISWRVCPPVPIRSWFCYSLVQVSSSLLSFCHGKCVHYLPESSEELEVVHFVILSIVCWRLVIVIHCVVSSAWCMTVTLSWSMMSRVMIVLCGVVLRRIWTTWYEMRCSAPTPLMSW